MFNDSFSAKPKESISLYNEYLLDKELLVIIERIKLIDELLRNIHNSNKNESIRENNDIYYMEKPKSFSKTLANIFLDIEVIF